jgi:hypothetical protein
MRIWIDADNPPQAQYLAPLAKEFRKRGCDVLVTARDHAATLAVLEHRGEKPVVLGSMFGRSKREKILGNLGRIRYLSRAAVSHFGGRPDALVVGQARGAILTAGLMRVPTFVILDYEGVEMASMKWSGAFILHPEIVPARRFEARGFPASRLIPVPGLKEDITFDGIDLGAMEPALLPEPHDPKLVSVLIRPPSQTSHYASDKTVQLLGSLLDRLARLSEVQLVFSPREASQIDLLSGREWKVAPVVLKETVPLVPLLKAVDWVVTGGGTMVREAAWLGVPGVSVFTGDPPAADEWLERQGALIRVLKPEDADSIDWANPGAMTTIEHHPEAIDAVAGIVLSRARRTPRAR